jgi:hypothetical protein
MKHLLWIIARTLGISLLIVWPLLAQEEGSGEDSGGDDDFEGSEFGDRGGGDREGERETAGPSPVDRAQEIFTKGGQPLSDEQLKVLQAFLEEQREARRQLAQQAPEQQAAAQGAPRGQSAPGAQEQGRMQRGPEGQAGERPQGRPPGGFRGQGPPGQRPGANPLLRQQAEAFLEKLLTLLTPEQQDVWKKYQREQTLARGGYPALRLALEEASASPSPEQETQLQELFRNYNEQLRQLRAGAGEGPSPDPAQLKAAEDAHLAQVAKILNPVQRRALLEWRRSTQKPPN